MLCILPITTQQADSMHPSTHPLASHALTINHNVIKTSNCWGFIVQQHRPHRSSHHLITFPSPPLPGIHLIPYPMWYHVTMFACVYCPLHVCTAVCRTLVMYQAEISSGRVNMWLSIIESLLFVNHTALLSHYLSLPANRSVCCMCMLAHAVEVSSLLYPPLPHP